MMMMTEACWYLSLETCIRKDGVLGGDDSIGWLLDGDDDYDDDDDDDDVKGLA